AVGPHPRDRGRQLLLVARRDALDRLVEPREGLVQVRGIERQPAVVAQRGEDVELHLVEERSARQWIDGLERLRFLARLEAVDGLEQEAVRAGGEVLERGGRERARPHAVARERRARLR